MTYVMKIIDETDVDDAIDDCRDVIENRPDSLSDKDIEFITELASQYEDSGKITEKQKVKLEKIWNKI